MRKILILGVAALAVASCSKKGADADGDGKISSEEAQAEMASGGKMAMKPGQWEIKMTNTEMDVPGVPEAVKAQITQKMAQGITVSSCLKPEDVEKPGGNFFGASNNDCTFNKLDRSGNKMTVDMTCKMQGMTMNSSMEGEFAEESYKLNVSQQMDMPTGGKMTSKGTLEGRRTGDCKA